MGEIGVQRRIRRILLKSMILHVLFLGFILIAKEIFVFLLLVYTIAASIPIRMFWADTTFSQVELPLEIAEKNMNKALWSVGICIPTYFLMLAMFYVTKQRSVYDLGAFAIFAVSGIALVFGTSSSLGNIVAANILLRRIAKR